MRLSKSPVLKFTDYVEQPLRADDWEDARMLASQNGDVAMMLDEPIVLDEHIQRAKDVGARFLKLKLFKQGGIREVVRQAKLAHTLGLKTVLGNGVATSVSNEIELRIQSDDPDLFYGASEANGFLKVSESASMK